MLILLYLDFFGALTSFIAHIGLALGYDLPTNRIAMTLNIGLGIVVFTRAYLTRELRKGKHWFFHKGLKNTCPNWLKITAGTFVTYGAVISVLMFYRVYCLIKTRHEQPDSSIAVNRLMIGTFAAIMLCYTVEFVLTTCYRTLEKRAEEEAIKQLLA